MFRKIFLAWLPLACFTTLFALLAYAVVQQDVRQSANDPQIEMAEDGVSPQSLSQIDISKSLAAFVIVFDDNGEPIASSGTLEGTVPIPPAGVFDYVRTSGGGNLRPTDVSGEDRFTWQPEPSVRIAAVVAKTDTGFILAGRNMREIESREEHILFITFLAWLFGIVGFFILEAFVIAAA